MSSNNDNNNNNNVGGYLMNKLIAGAFPAARQSTYKPFHRQIVRSRQVISSASFQMVLYYNVFFFLIYIFLYVLLIQWKSLNADDIETKYKNTKSLIKYVNPVVFTLWFILELYRLYLGYIGNLKEKVPHLVAFFFISIFPQSPFILYFIFNNGAVIKLEKILAIIYLVFMIFEIITGWLAANRIISNKTARFNVEYGDVLYDGNNRANNVDYITNTSSLQFPPEIELTERKE